MICTRRGAATAEAHTSPAAALTTIVAKAIFTAMRKFGPVTLVARAVFLALVGVVIASGAAFAHGGPVAGDRPHARVQTANEPHSHESSVATVLSSQETPERADYSEAPCSGERSGGHLAGGCCNVACHAALAALGVGPPVTCHPPSQRIASLSDILVGRSGDRDERPPKRG